MNEVEISPCIVAAESNHLDTNVLPRFPEESVGVFRSAAPAVMGGTCNDIPEDAWPEGNGGDRPGAN